MYILKYTIVDIPPLPLLKYGGAERRRPFPPSCSDEYGEGIQRSSPPPVVAAGVSDIFIIISDSKKKKKEKKG